MNGRIVLNWPIKDVEYLTKNYGLVPTRDIAIYLSRTFYAVAHKARQLKLTHPHFSPAIDRFMSKIAISKSEYQATPCWEWTGFLNKDGYGQFSICGKYVRPHRWAYEYFIEPIPDGLVADHLCENQTCVNPMHVQICPQIMNVLRGNAVSAINARKTHCIRGHEFNEENTHINKSNKRRCRMCDKESKRAKYICH
jgi:hypothetical protein